VAEHNPETSAPPHAMSDLDTAIADDAYTERVRLLLQNFPSTVVVNLLVSLVFAILMLEQTSSWHVTAWLALMLVSLALRTTLTYRCRRNLNNANARRWTRRFIWGALSAGTLWGIAGVMFPTEGKEAFAAFTLGGLAAGAVAMNAAFMGIYLGFVLPMLLPVALMFFLGGDGLPGMINGGLTLFFVLVMTTAAWRYNQSLRSALELGVAQRRMSEELRLHRDHLQQLVAARTEDLEAARKAAEAANESKTHFLASASHELRTPMHAILSFAAIGEEQAADAPRDKLKDYFSYVRTSGKRLLKLINDLLDLSKMQSGHLSLDSRPQAVRDLVETVRAEFEALLAEKDLTLLDLDPEVDTAVTCDSGRVLQVLQNLIANAVKFSPPGGTISVHFAATTLPAARRGGPTDTRPALAVRVEDQGMGVPEAELESIFDKFVQSSRTGPDAGGTGLGLAICREIVHGHGGTISARNREHQGASFCFVIPRDGLEERIAGPD
jgi:signal transduction histidine kinase